MKPSLFRQFTQGVGKQIAIVIIMALALLTVAYMSIDLLNMGKCSMCGDVTIGKQEAIADKPVCERCYERG
jgi:hypothetical protein